ncbi:RSP_2648 family PIN domain-containing protein [Tabrizicola oligotrophica]|uniref:PIN domain-containing protein n=1 Tax=Tabrizicola oligotrophica TaxID=2710650 RepID=A0A6M0QN16_9RHOB|nr:PIN domain-containing protein [Tabrizicola oligotrophica]NEY88785.1 PIN domain-containing protein [Tabrizicola oligotrophica]
MKAVLDACVLFPTVLREILLGVAGRGLYQPLWSERILREWVRATAKLGEVAAMEAEAQATLARLALPQAMCREQPGIEARLLLPDPNDLHVLAIAIAAHADAIVTFNAQDFPRHLLAEEGLERLDPDQFLCALHARHPAEVAQVVADVHATAERMLGEAIPLKALMKRAQLRRLGKALETAAG